MKNGTLNKDGAKRKVGSGRTKGSKSFMTVKLRELAPFVGEETPIVVSRVWLERLGYKTNNRK